MMHDQMSVTNLNVLFCSVLSDYLTKTLRTCSEIVLVMTSQP